MRFDRLLSTALLLTTALVAPVALADDAPRPEPSAADKATARALLDEGDALLKKGDVRGALAKYQAADAIMGVPTTGAALAEAQVRLGLLVEAADTFARVQRFPVKPGESEVFTRARREAERRFLELGRRIPSATVELVGGTANEATTVAIDGAALPGPARFLPRKLNPGKHEVVVASGALRGVAEFTLAEGESRVVRVMLAATGAPPDGSGDATKGGSDTTKGGGDTTKGGGDTTKGSGADAAPPEGASSRGLHPAVWASLGVGVAGLAIGGVTGGLALGKKDTLEASCPANVCPPGAGADALDAARTLATVSTVGFVVGGAAGGVALLTWALTKDSAAPAKTATAATAPPTLVVLPVVGLGYLGLQGAF